MNKININLKKKILELSLLSRETQMGGFVLSHQKNTGLFRVIFAQQIFTKKSTLQYTELETAVDEGIKWIKSRRRKTRVAEHYTLTGITQFKTN